MNFGILTLATPNDYKKAIGLALSARITNPGIPLAVACSSRIAHLLSPYFDQVVPEDGNLRGFVHKVYLDKYTPFENTFFFDSDVLLFRNLMPIVEAWSEYPYVAVGRYMDDGFSSFGLDRKKVLHKIGKSKLVVIDGAGHAFFRKPLCSPVFELAREVTQRHLEYAGPIRYADEDVMDIAMTILDLPPASHPEFFSRYVSAVPGTLKMDARIGLCEFTATRTGDILKPYMMHFAANEAPFPYAMQLAKLFSTKGLNTAGLYYEALIDSYQSNVNWPLRSFIKQKLSFFK